MNIKNKVTGELASITTYDPATGAITGLVPVGNTTLGSNANVIITGGNVGEVLTTDGAGNLSWSGGGSGSYSNVDANAFMTAGLVGDIIPNGNNVANLGSLSNQFRDLFLSNATIYFNGFPLTVGTANGVANSLLYNSLPVVTSDGNANITTSGNVTSGNVIANGAITANGNIVANAGYFFQGDGGQLSNITIAAGTAITDGNSNVEVNSVTETITMGANGVSNVAVINESNATFIANVVASQFLYANGDSITVNYGNSNVFSYLQTYNGDLPQVGNVVSSGNVTADYLIGNGSQLTGMYGNADVANYLPTYTGDLGNVGNITASGNLVAGNLDVTPGGEIAFGSGGNVYSIPTGGLTGTVTVNGVNDRGISLTAGGTTPGSSYAQIQWVQDINAYDPYDPAGSITNWVYTQFDGTYIENFDLLNVPGYNYSWKFGIDGVLTAAGDITTPGNVTANYFIGDGSQLTGLPANYGNTNVANYLPTYTGNLGNVNTIVASGNVSAANLTVSGKSVLGAVGNITITGGTTGQTLTTNGSGVLSWATPAATYGNANVANYLPTYTGNVGAGNVNVVTKVTANSVSLGTGNLQLSGNLISTTASTITIDPLGDGSAAGNVIVQGNMQVTGTLTYNSVVNATTNDLQWIAANNAINQSAASGAGISVGPAGVYAALTYNAPANAWQSSLPFIATGGVDANGALTGATTGTFSANVTAPFFIGNGSQLTGLPATYANSDVANYLASNANVVVTTTGNITAPHFIGNGSQLTSLPVQSIISNGSSNVNIDALDGNILLQLQGSWAGRIGTSTVSIGTGAGNSSQLTGAVAVGINAGGSQQAGAVAIGSSAGRALQRANAIAIGVSAGISTQSANSIAIGANAASNIQGADSIAIGVSSGANSQGANSVAIGYSSGSNSQGGNSVAIGYSSANSGQGANSVAIGPYTGFSSQGTQAVAVGDGAGQTNQGAGAIAIGRAGTTNQQGNAIAIGAYTAMTSQGANAIAIGSYSGGTNQAANSISIGANSQTSAAAIVLNATGANLLGDVAGFYVNPVRNDTTAANTTQAVTYNTTSRELTYTNTLNLTGTVQAVNFISGDVSNANSTRTRIAYFGANSYIQTGNGTVGSTGNIIFSPYSEATPKVVINTTTGNITANNIGNVAAVNLNGDASSFLNGAGTWSASSGGGGMRNITKVVQGYNYGTQLMLADGRVYAMKGSGGQQGWTSALNPNDQSVPLQAGIQNAYEISFINEDVGTCVDVGAYGPSAYALFSNGNLYTWGYNGYGQLGIGSTTDSRMPVLSNTNVAQVYTHPSQAQGTDYSIQRLVIRKTNNTFWGCGHDGQYQLGLGTNTAKTSWTALTWIPTDVLSVWNLGGDLGNIIIQLANGNIQATGYNNSGQLGLGNNSQPTVPVNAGVWLAGDATMRIQYIGWGGPLNGGGGQNNNVNITMFLDNGTTSLILGAGANNTGVLGINNTTDSLVPVAPNSTSGLTGARIAKMLTAGPSYKTIYVLTTAGVLFSWGYNGYGQVGNGNTTNQLVPYQLTTSVLDIEGEIQGWDIAGYASMAPYVKKSTGYFTCGFNGYGQLGDTTATTSSTLKQLYVPKGTTFKFFGCSGNNEGLIRYGITQDNTIWAWGYNAQGAVDPLQTGWNAVVPLQFTPNALRNI